MRSLGSLFSSAVVLSTLLVPAVGMASEPHSWCVPGAPMNYAGSNDNVTNEVIYYVCGTPAAGGIGMTACCTGRWTLACVQTAAEYASTTLQAGDVCGRFAWAQGPVGSGLAQGLVALPHQQYYPRDFSLFVLGDAKGIGDVQGPVAAQGSITAASFSLNSRQQEPTALVATGSITLGNTTSKTGGTVWGSVLYGTTFSDTPQVTYVNGTRPTTAQVSNYSPIDFVDASNSLLNMSKQVALYDAIKPTPSNYMIKFTGSDSELNVFSIPSTALSGVTVFQFNVPAGSAVIINVTGKTVSFLNAGSSTSTGGSILTLNLQSVLWNFPDATMLTLQSAGILGSILAPKAATTITYGAIVGTVVAQSVNLNAEIDWNPYQVPSSGGASVSIQAGPVPTTRPWSPAAPREYRHPLQPSRRKLAFLTFLSITTWRKARIAPAPSTVSGMPFSPPRPHPRSNHSPSCSTAALGRPRPTACSVSIPRT